MNEKLRAQGLSVLMKLGAARSAVHLRDLDAVSFGSPMGEESRKELNALLKEMTYHLTESYEDGSVLYPTLEELQDLYFCDKAGTLYLNHLISEGLTATLTLEQEQTLAETRQDGWETALMEGSLLRVVSLARRYRGSGMTLLDLIMEGNEGLKEAIRTYDPEQQVSFALVSSLSILESIDNAMDLYFDSFREAGRPTDAMPQSLEKARMRMDLQIRKLLKTVDTDREVLTPSDCDRDVSVDIQPPEILHRKEKKPELFS